ncbi:hypothetical protein RI367_005846 [Sorochytrium milnesiophthora]
MGNETSTSGQHYYTAPLVSPTIPLAAIAANFCMPTALHLTLAPSTEIRGGNDLEVQDATTQMRWFTTSGKLPHDTVTLHDANHDVLLSLTSVQLPLAVPRVHMYTCAEPTRLAADIHHSATRVSARTFRIDVTTLDNRTVALYYQVPANSYDAFLFQEDPRAAHCPRLVAKLIRTRPSPGAAGDGIQILVAPAMDVALVTALAVFMYRRRNTDGAGACYYNTQTAPRPVFDTTNTMTEARFLQFY